MVAGATLFALLAGAVPSPAPDVRIAVATEHLVTATYWLVGVGAVTVLTALAGASFAAFNQP